MTELIGLEFKRNVYGYSTWTDTVKAVWIRYRIIKGYQVPEIMVKGSLHSYPLTEVVLCRQPDTIQKLQIAKQEYIDSIRESLNKLESL